ncbi:MAG TPA: hypothetical protein VLM80_02455 [Anaerolineales bacterium]|nr:hypothetical protein [Anaerolineales bacterium]
MDSMPSVSHTTRIGFHYYPDTLHYRDADLTAWLPELQAMAVSWLVLQAPLNRAIPESFIRRLISHSIQPILHFHFSLGNPPTTDEFSLLCRAYARWGARYVVLFDRPNCRASWPAAIWSQCNLVERFLDVFQPMALTAIQAGLIPVFPPLEPGGDYWDTAFLRNALEGLTRRNQQILLDRMVIGAYAGTNGHPLSWGSGGQERWPAARPYETPKGSEDQRGFRIFDWYLPICEAVFGERRSIILLGAGCHQEKRNACELIPEETARSQNLLIARLMMGEKLSSDPVPGEVLACNFWLLTANNDHPEYSDAWFHSNGDHKPVVDDLQQWANAHHWTHAIISRATTLRPIPSTPNRPIAHYLLLPDNQEGEGICQLETLRPLLFRYHPTIGFSLSEAVLARRVTVLGNPNNVPDAIIDGLTTAGCIVDDLRGDGTTIASILENLQ